ncbi:hypothetical protein [Pedobacter kyonggii]|uniref:Uncharacterized protein n=1 Tax=Pedobacter kyonggii TaxID=1926871 RepID=A0A4Q9H3Q0_9SPHI|nr:hypothetical protein [Pedobacter kyonggii]TBO36378.1 hypothetical protein EYS08_24910 [Pedobacter kyonggii]
MTPDQSKVVETILNMIMKVLFGLSALAGWWIILFKWIDAQTQFDLWKFGAIESFLSATIYIVFKHYFGAIRK